MAGLSEWCARIRCPQPRQGQNRDPGAPGPRSALRPRLLLRSRFRHDDLGGRVEGNLRGAADDEVGTFPGPLRSVERHLLSHPPGVVRRRPVRGPVGPVDRVRLRRTGPSPPCHLPFVGLHPDQRVDQLPDLPPPGPVALNHQQRAPSRDVDGSLPPVLGPPRRPKTDPPALTHRRQDPVRQQIRPTKARMLPRNVIRMHDSRPGNRPADPRRQRGLARVAPPIHRQNDRTAGHDPARPTPDKRLDNGSQQLSPPRPGLRLLRSKLQSHAPIMPGSPAAAVAG
jgi:hypothetical protein